MSERLSDPTPYPEVNALLEELLSRVRQVLRDRFLGMYLYGSLARGDFDPDRSDIDFIVVTDDDLPDEAMSSLGAMHSALVKSGIKGAERLEGAYMPLSALRRYDPDHGAVPTINEGRFYLARQRSDWVIQRHDLREQGVVVAGPPLKTRIDPVKPRDLRRAVVGFLQEWWEPLLDDPARLESARYRSYAVLTMCRALYTLEHGRLVSKMEAATWALDALDEMWRGPIEAALFRRYQARSLRLDRTKDFIRFTIERSRQGAGPTRAETGSGERPRYDREEPV